MKNFKRFPFSTAKCSKLIVPNQYKRKQSAADTDETRTMVFLGPVVVVILFQIQGFSVAKEIVNVRLNQGGEGGTGRSEASKIG